MAENLEQQIEALETQIEQFYGQGDYEQALSLAQEAYDLSRKLPDPEHPLLATALNNLEVVHQAMESYAQALPLLEQAVARAPDDLEAQAALGSALGGLKRYDAALTILDKVLTSSGEFERAARQLTDTARSTADLSARSAGASENASGHVRSAAS